LVRILLRAIQIGFAKAASMKATMILALMILTLTGHAACAVQSYSDIDVISVTPRSLTVKPYVLAIFTNEQRQRLAAASMKKRALPAASRQ